MSASRRHFLQTLGVGALGLSCLNTSRTLAQNKPLPKRFVLFFSPNGTIPEAWGTDGSETDFTFRRILEPLEPYRSKVCVLEGLDMKSTDVGPGDGHQKGMGHLFTGVELLPGDVKGGCDSCPPASFASGPSVDQVIARQIGKDTRLSSLELGLSVGGGEDAWTRMIYRDRGQPLPPEQDPVQVFERVFAGLEQDPFGVERRKALKKSVLDFVYKDFASLSSRLSRVDQQKLDLHQTTLREIERRLESAGNLGASCTIPGQPQNLDFRSSANADTVGHLHMDLMAMALACDITRVGSMQWTRSVGQLSFPFIGINDRHHDLSHEGDGNADAKEKLIEINRWYAEQLAYFLGRLAAIPEGDGTVLDNTLVLWGNELGKGNSHTPRDIPFVLAGGAGGALRTGRALRFTDRPHNDLLTTVCQAMGLEQTSFGDARFNTGALSELLV